MRVKTKHETIGEIEYYESAWTGKKELSINGTPLEKVNKTTYKYVKGEKEIVANFDGNYLSGSKLTIENQTVQLTPAVKWYEVVLSIFIVAFVCIWGNVEALCKIVPIIGGAVGGAISGLLAVLNLLAMKATSKIWLKLLIWFGFMGLTFGACYLGAIIYLSIAL